MIVTWRFLQSYSFLNDTHVARQWKGEEPIDVIKRMLKTPAPELAATRVAIGELREQLNARALGMIKVGGLLVFGVAVAGLGTLPCFRL